MSDAMNPGGVQQAPPPPQKKDNTVMYILSYLGILCLIPLLTEKDDPDVQWHAKHGLVLLVAEIILYIALGIFFFILAKITMGIGGLIGCVVWPVVGIGILVMHIMMIMKAIKGQRMLIPGVSDFVNRF